MDDVMKIEIFCRHVNKCFGDIISALLLDYVMKYEILSVQTGAKHKSWENAGHNLPGMPCNNIWEFKKFWGFTVLLSLSLAWTVGSRQAINHHENNPWKTVI